MLSPTHTADAVIIVPVSGSATLNEIVVKSSSLGGSDGTLVRVQGGRADIEDLWMECELKENSHFVEIVCGRLSVSRVGVKNGVGVESSLVWMEGGNVSVVRNISSCERHCSLADLVPVRSVRVLVAGEDKILPAPFFVPSLSSNTSTSKFNTTEQKFDIVLKGETFVPCGLSLEVFERIAHSKTEFSEGEHVLVELDPSEVTTWKEDTIELSLHQSTISSLNRKHDLHCRVLFGESGKTDSFSLTGVKGKMSQAGRIVSIVVPIVCSVVLLLILLVVVLVLVCRRHQKKTIQEQSKQLNELDECQVEVKEDDIDNHSTIKPFFTASVETLHPHSLNMISNGVAQDQPEISSTRPQCIEYVDVLKCEGEPAVVRVDAKKTLYSALHFEKTLTLPKMEIRRQLVAGLDRLVQHNPFSDVLTQLSSHWILVDSSGSVCLKLDQHTNEMGLTTVEIANRKKMREEDRRWSAPEQIDEEMDHKNKDEKEKASQAVPFDPLKASVFRLGLVLWELETGVVPFGELDAVNASRQVKGGQVPLIENWEDTSLASIVGECLSFDPNERPSLSDLKKHFSSSSTPLDPPNVQQQPIASVAVTG
ncbi:hypothetical protein BLNAU_23489 [Blattamonas nauphoetae]|uniref:Protein kinase domain-containing protein n=1 Tax=Blattamonas nauphoetae TaxID=2049346 RepID=A0ABQ9WQ52_9EUKA|nr:hypothetical protein BLNAU_23489 [Blattamonas nauphoetae]